MDDQMDGEAFITIHQMITDFAMICHLLSYQSRSIMPFSLHPCFLLVLITFFGSSNTTAGIYRAS